MNDLNMKNTVNEADAWDTWLKTKSALVFELERLLAHPELIAFDGALDALVEYANTTRILFGVRTRSAHTTEASVPSTDGRGPSTSCDDDDSGAVSSKHPPGGSDASRDGLRDATRVLVGLASQIHEHMRVLDEQHEPWTQRIERCLSWAARGDELAVLDVGPRRALLHAIVAFVLMSQHELGASTRPRGDVSELFKKLCAERLRRDDEGGTFHIHGPKRDCTPRGQSWRDDWERWMNAFDGFVRTPTVSTSTSSHDRAKSRDRTDTAPSAQVTLEGVLRGLVREHGDRVVVLGEAMESAKRSRGFAQVDTASELLGRLVEDYLPRYLEGGDELARGVFTNAQYAAGASETTRNDPGAMASRTFVYEGKQIECVQHLRIGRRDDVRKCWRCHFYIDRERERVVIGHCGAHLATR